MASSTLSDDVLAELADRLDGRHVVVLTGAGVSTESGIPDYRSPEALARVRRPIHGPDFIRSAALRQRYWARAMVGWERFGRALPGAAHHAIARLEASGLVTGVITQNVDRLHHAAGSRRVVELHGALADVVCLGCGAIEKRDNVPRAVVDEAFGMLEEGDALLVAGTSLAVFSGYRFLRRAVERAIPIAIVNRGPVRGEEHAILKIEASTGAVLDGLASRLA
jgi:NAD-dependent deacetylase sirtuin 4